MNLRWGILALGAVACGPGLAKDATGTGTTAGPATTSDTDPTVAASTGEGSSSTGETSTGETSTGEASTAGPASTGHDDPPPNTTYCPLDQPASGTIAGMTPQGPFTGAYARFGWVGCFGYAYAPELVILPDEQALVDALAGDFDYYDGGARPFPALRLHLYDTRPFEAWQEDGGWTGETTGHVDLFMTDGDESVGGHAATVTVTMSTSVPATQEPTEVPRIVGTLTVQGGGWDLTGTFEAAYCGALTWGHECA